MKKRVEVRRINTLTAVRFRNRSMNSLRLEKGIDVGMDRSGTLAVLPTDVDTLSIGRANATGLRVLQEKDGDRDVEKGRLFLEFGTSVRIHATECRTNRHQLECGQTDKGWVFNFQSDPNLEITDIADVHDLTVGSWYTYFQTKATKLTVKKCWFRKKTSVRVIKPKRSVDDLTVELKVPRKMEIEYSSCIEMG